MSFVRCLEPSFDMHFGRPSTNEGNPTACSTRTWGGSMVEEGPIDVLWEWVIAREMTVGWVDECQTQDKDVEWVEGWWGKEMDVGWVKGWWG